MFVEEGMDIRNLSCTSFEFMSCLNEIANKCATSWVTNSQKCSYSSTAISCCDTRIASDLKIVHTLPTRVTVQR